MTDNLPVPALCKTIRALIDKGDHAAEKAEQFYVAAGIRLRELRERKPAGTAWPEYVKAKVGLSKSRSNELIALADGRATLADQRADKAESVRKVRADRPLRSGQSLSSGHSNGLAVTTAQDPDDPQQEIKESFFTVAELALRISDLDLSEVEVTAQMRETAEQVLNEWTKAREQLQ